MTAALLLTDGTVSAPGVAFNSEPTTGWYRNSGNDIRLSIAGTDQALYGSNSLTYKSSLDTAAVGPSLVLWRDSASPASSDLLGQIKFDGEDDGGAQTTFASIDATLVTATDGAEDGSLALKSMQAGTLTTVLTLDEAGDATFAGGISITGTIDVGTVDVDSLTVNTDATFAGATIANLGTVTTADIDGGTIDGVTIGGSSAGAGTFTNITGSGTIDFTGATVSDLGTVTTADIDGGTIDGVTIGGSSAAAGSFTTITGSGDLAIDTDTLFVDVSAGNVGIGTSSPSTALHISTPDPVLRISDSNTGFGANSTGKIEFTQSAGNVQAYIEKVAGDPDLVISNTAAGNLRLKTDDTEAMRINSDGNVGIGTSSPGYELDVAGTINAEDIRLINPSNVAQLSVFDVDNVHGADIFCIGTTWSIRGTSSTDFRIGPNGNFLTIATNGDADIDGALSKNSGSFKIDHPLKPETHHLVHSFVEGPQADNLYRGTVSLANGKATVNLDAAARLTEGTFLALNTNIQCFVTNEDGWELVRGRIEGNVLHIESKESCDDTVSWLVIGERHDQHIIETEWTDYNGRVITEPAKLGES